MKAKLMACMWVEPGEMYFDMEVHTRSVLAVTKKYEEGPSVQKQKKRVVGVAFHYHFESEETFKGKKVELRGYLGSSGGFARRSYPGAKLLTRTQAGRHDPQFAEEMRKRNIKYALLLPFSIGMYSLRMFAVKKPRVYKGYITANRVMDLWARPWYILHPSNKKTAG